MQKLEALLPPDLASEVRMMAFEGRTAKTILKFIHHEMNDTDCTTLKTVYRFIARTTGNKLCASHKRLPKSLVDQVVEKLQAERLMEKIVEDTGLTVAQIRRIKREAGLTRKYHGMMKYMVSEDSMKCETRRGTRLEFLADVRQMAPWEVREKYPELTPSRLTYWRKKLGVERKRSKYTPDAMEKLCRDAGLVMRRLDGEDMLTVTVSYAAHRLGIPYWTFRYHIERSSLRRPVANELRQQAREAKERTEADVRKELAEIQNKRAIEKKERENAPVFVDEDEDYTPDPKLLAAVLANEDIE